MLLALRQEPPPLVVFIDEMENSLHPAAQSVIMDALLASTDRCQVVATTHSPEVASHPDLSGSMVRILNRREGKSDIYGVRPSALDILKPPESVGRLMHSNALWPDHEPSVVQEEFWEIAP